MKSLATTRETLTIAEFKERVSQLQEEEWIRLGMSADYLARGLAITGKELLSEAFCKALEGSRNCPNELAIHIFLYGVMRSLVSDYLKKRKRDLLHQAAPIDDEFMENYLLKPSLDTPEEELLAKQTLERIEEAFRDDDVAQMIFMGKDDGYTPKQIQESLGLSGTQYESALTAIRRKITKLSS